MTDAAPTALPGPVFYLTGEYPRATDTFIQREVAALRALGVDVRTCSVRATSPSHHVGPEQKAEAARTYAVQPAARRPGRLLSDHWAALRASPRRYLRALGLALASGAPGAKGLLYQLFYFAEAGVLARRMAEAGAFHLHNHFGNSSCSVAMLASALSGVPYSYTLHGPAELFEPTSWRIDRKIARAAFVACISWFARSQGMLFSDPRHWDRLHIVHCGVDPSLYDRPRTPSAGGPRLLFVGRLAAIKGLFVLFDAFERVRAARPDAMLTLIGDGPDRTRLEAEAARRGFGAAVLFAGYRSQAEVAAALAEADLFVLPSFAEGVPVVLMEAMASRTPVVATRVAGVPELVEDGVSGLLAPPGDAAALAAGVEVALADPERARRMGEAGRAKVVAEFDAAREAAWLLEILRRRRLGGAPPEVRPPDPPPGTASRSGSA